MGCGNAREHLLMMRPGAVSLFLLVIGCATAAGQAVPAERPEGVLRPPDLRDFDVGPSWAFRAHRRSSRRVADW